MINGIENICDMLGRQCDHPRHFERSEKSAFSDCPAFSIGYLKADSSSHSLLGMTKAAGRIDIRHVMHVLMSISFFALLLLLMLPASTSFSAPKVADPPNPTIVRHELKQILSQPQYSRVYKENHMPKWWAEFRKKVGLLIKKALMWLMRSLSLHGGQSSRLTSFVFACIVIIAFFALLMHIIRRLYVRIRTNSKNSSEAHIGHYDLPSARPLISEAEKLAASGDWRGAFRCMYLASISHLDEIGALRFERSRTNWEYLNELDKGGLRSFRDHLIPLTTDFDRKFYGRERCDRGDYFNALSVYERIRSDTA